MKNNNISVTHHISGTVKHIMIFGTHVLNDDISRCWFFFHFFEILIFRAVRGLNRQKNPK